MSSVRIERAAGLRKEAEVRHEFLRSVLPGCSPRVVPPRVNSPELCFLCFFSSPTGNLKGMCKQIDHFPEETDYEADPSEYFLREYLVSPRSHTEKSSARVKNDALLLLGWFVLEGTTGIKKKKKKKITSGFSLSHSLSRHLLYF